MDFNLRSKLSGLDTGLAGKLLGLAVVIAAGWLFARDYAIVALLVLFTGLVSWGTAKFGVKWTGIELATVSTVLIGTMFGPATGAVAGFFIIILQLSAGQYIGPYVLWVIPGYILAGFLPSILSGNIFTVGMTIIVGLQVLFSLMTFLVTPGGLSKYLPYAAGNVVFNFLAFSFLAPRLLGFM